MLKVYKNSKNSLDSDTRMEAASCLGSIDPSNQTAIEGLIEVIRDPLAESYTIAIIRNPLVESYISTNMTPRLRSTGIVMGYKQ